MSTIGSSAAGLLSTSSVLKPVAVLGSSSAKSFGRGPSNMSVGRTAPDANVGDVVDVAGRGAISMPASEGAAHAVDAAVATLDRQQKAAFDAKRHLDEQSERISDLVNRFEKAIGRIRQFLRTNDLEHPPGPADVGRRMSDSLVSGTTRNLKIDVAAPDETNDAADESDRAADQSRGPLNVVA